MATFENFKDGVLKNWVILAVIVVGIYTTGTLNSEFLQEKQKRIEVEVRLSKKIKVIYENKKYITELEKHISFEKGEKQGLKAGYQQALKDIDLIKKYSKQ